MIQAAIFDLDGLLIDSQPLWQQAMGDIYRPLGVPMDLALEREVRGLRLDEVAAHWARRFPWGARPTQAETMRALECRVCELVEVRGTALPGVQQAVVAAVELGLPLGVASSSTPAIIAAALRRLRLTEAFQAVHSAADEAYGKPHPVTYLSAAASLGVPATDCLAFEDSVNGVLAAKAARMRCIAVPAAEERHLPAFGLADLVLDSLEQVTPDLLRGLA